MSKLTDAQLAAVIRASEATEARHRANGDELRAQAAAGRAHRNRTELERRRQAAGDQPGQEAHPQKPARRLETREDATPSDAISQASSLVRKWGGTAAVRALQIALKNAPGEIMDVAEGVRMIQMQREVAP